MAIIIQQEQRNDAENALKVLQKNINSFLDDTYIQSSEDKSTGTRLKDMEATYKNLQEIVDNINDAYTKLLNVITFNVMQQYPTEIDNLREQYLIEETDTPREAAENIEQYIETQSDIRLLVSSLKFLHTLLPPTEKEYIEIPYDTATIEDANMFVGDKIVEVEGVPGEVEIIYEIIDDERIELKRTVLQKPITEVIRVGTMPIPEPPVEPEETENPEENEVP